MPAGLVIWLFANIGINGSSILEDGVELYIPFEGLVDMEQELSLIHIFPLAKKNNNTHKISGNISFA